ncbi:MAG: monofunctional biosynthetic peptidoglycan transglycosylase [Bacteroidaceae bacterium]|nr:monofunctional biosynthetic peptidoglycan transglycosylase [Bacteroidaceae bacterium]MBQ8454457.1 monofunctional biosynthetic peptidoglycan transglycosylase [Bacteroidaceae bacterium]
MRKLQLFLRWIVLLFFGSTILAVLIYKWCPVYVTPLMIIRCAQQVSRGEKLRLKHHWVPLDSMSIYMPVAVMASEDQRFLDHNGFDFIEINKTLEERRSGKRFRGGSTISQQTAKNVFLWPKASWVRKGLEAYFTVLIELIWGKERIMEVYLNSVEMGDGIYGAEAVAQQHFGRRAITLTRPNCALIAATLPNPLKFCSKEPSSYMLKRQTAIMTQMRHIDVFPRK